jgi:protein-tyrosine phosphatase
VPNFFFFFFFLQLHYKILVILFLGRILVHCLMGMSRSSACVIAYLMIQQGHSAPRAVQTVRKGRDVRPNKGFMRQLAELELELMDGRKD